MSELTFVPDPEHVVDIVSHAPDALTVRLSPRPDPGGGGGGGGAGEVQVIKNTVFAGEGNWRRGESPVIYDWENVYPFPKQATTGKGEARPAAIDDPPSSGRFKAAEHNPPQQDDGPIPYGATAAIKQLISLTASYTKGRLEYRQVAHFDLLNQVDFSITISQRVGDWSQAFSLDVVEYVWSGDPTSQPWQKFGPHEFDVDPNATEILVTITCKMPSSGSTGLKLSDFFLFLS